MDPYVSWMSIATCAAKGAQDDGSSLTVSCLASCHPCPAAQSAGLDPLQWWFPAPGSPLCDYEPFFRCQELDKERTLFAVCSPCRLPPESAPGEQFLWDLCSAITTSCGSPSLTHLPFSRTQPGRGERLQPVPRTLSSPSGCRDQLRSLFVEEP